ncbi:MAG TPA: hypothetical protein VFK13_15450 [Gemmatimonadaceae bacterium]|nr:hypothetical protein [Gemmatimonadaceae bacterium]
MAAESPEQQRPEGVYYGGADAVPDTPGSARHGAEPNQDPGPAGADAPLARVRSSGGLPVALWVVLAVLAIAALLYGIGFSR